MKSTALSTLDLLDETLSRAADELEARRAQLASTNPANWRRLLLEEPKRRAKTIPLRETYAASQVPTVTRTKDEVAIERQRGLPGTAVQHANFAQCYVPNNTDERYLSVIRRLGCATTEEVSEALGETFLRVRSVLKKLSAKGLIVGRAGAGGGWRIAEPRSSR